MTKSAKKPVVLIIRDGWGINPGGHAQAEANGDATLLARTPFHDHLYATYPWARVSGSGEDVGLPAGQLGNSEVGHNAIGDNHIGDWGTQFGMIIYGYRHFRDDAAYRANPVEELSRLYRLTNQLVSYFEAKQELPKLAEKLKVGEAQLAAAQAAAAEGCVLPDGRVLEGRGRRAAVDHQRDPAFQRGHDVAGAGRAD